MDADRRAARLASRQHDVLSHPQLLACGLTQDAVKWRIRRGRLHRLHEGVYAWGRATVSPAGRRMAAVLACGPGAVLSHQTAADLWNIRPSASRAIHVTVPTATGRRRPGIVIHRSRTLGAADVTRRDAIPVTTVARTLEDLSRKLPAGDLRKAVERANRQRLLHLGDFDGHLARRLKEAIDAAYLGDLRSPLESDFLALCREHGIPLPAVNTLVHGKLVDFFWPEHGLVVEVDGWNVHGGRAAFQDDRTTDVDLALEGIVVVRFTHDDVNVDGARTAAKVLRLLGATGSRACGTSRPSR